MDLREPKRKRVGSHIKPQQPFPILIESENDIPFGSEVWPIFIGNFTGDSVVVCNPEEMVSLYKMGFFGKGSFSRGYPSFGTSKRGVPPLVKERQWKRRKLWMEKIEKGFLHSQAQEDSNENDPQTEKENAESCNQPIQNSDNATKTIPMEVEEKGTEISDSSTVTNTKNSNNREENTESCNQLEQSSNVATETLPIEVAGTETECPKSSAVSNKDSNSPDIHSYKKTSSTGIDQSKDHLNKYSEVDVIGKLLVIADSDEEDIEKVVLNPQPHLEDEPIKTVMETLYLSLEEAFFLSFALGCLHVIDMSGNAMSLNQLWNTFCQVTPDFIELYVGYHHFRSKGWVVKTGHKFGGDFLLYKQGPPFYHASYIVLVEKVDSQLRKETSTLTWTKLHGLNRLAESSGKDIITCQVLLPESLTSEDLKSPKSLTKCQVNELLTKRWISSQEREDKET